MLEKLTWDSDFFRLNVGQLLTEDEQFALDEHPEFDLIYLKSKHAFALKTELFTRTFCEEKLFFTKEVRARELDDNTGLGFFDEHLHKEDKLIALGLQSGALSRYNLDPQIKPSDFKKLYELWVINSIRKEIATDVVVYTEKDEAVGFLSFKMSAGTLAVGLFAVDAACKGLGIGKKMLLFLENHALGNNIREISIPTQGTNEGARAFYEKLGYTIQKKEYICHYWKK